MKIDWADVAMAAIFVALLLGLVSVVSDCNKALSATQAAALANCLATDNDPAACADAVKRGVTGQ